MQLKRLKWSLNVSAIEKHVFKHSTSLHFKEKSRERIRKTASGQDGKSGQ
jgi:hypothetical protein